MNLRSMYLIRSTIPLVGNWTIRVLLDYSDLLLDSSKILYGDEEEELLPSILIL